MHDDSSKNGCDDARLIVYNIICMILFTRK